MKPDIICIAKAITGGYFPFGATLVNARIAAAFEAIDAPEAMITHGYTYSGHPVGCAAAIAALSMTRELKSWENAALRGARLAKGLQDWQQKHTLVGDTRAKGLMAGVEIVVDRRTKQPADKKLMGAILAKAVDAGVMIRTMETTSSCRRR